MKSYPLVLASIHPSLNPSYSPNLHAWVKKNTHIFGDGGTPDTVWKLRAGAPSDLPEGTLYIGHKDGGLFSGARLNMVLCYGAKQQRVAYVDVARHVTPVEDFWQQYKILGRCAIDPEHKIYFLGDRWSERGDARTCLWCGHQQRLLRWNETVERTRWAAAQALAGVPA